MPHVPTLISSVLPFTSADAALEHLVRFWGDAFSLERVVLAWGDEDRLTAAFAQWSQPDAFARREVPISNREDCQPAVLQKRLDRGDELHWQRLTQTPSGWIGTAPAWTADRSADLEPYLQTTGTLLQTILTWEATLQERKLDALAEYAAGAGHEINNPLGTISGRAAQLLKGETDPQRRRALETIGGQTYRIRDMIGDSMLFARPPAPQREPVDLTAIVQRVLDGFADEFASRQVEVDRRAVSKDDVIVLVDPTQLAVVVSELIRNAMEAEAQRIIVECSPVRANESPAWPIDSDHKPQTGSDQRSKPRAHMLHLSRMAGRLRIADDGTGLTEQQREHCFDPFYSGREAGRGLGFGLSKCWRIVRQHEGWMELVRSAPPMTEFQVWLPSASGSTPPVRSGEDSDSVPSSPG